jgi:hypothetical protein
MNIILRLSRLINQIISDVSRLVCFMRKLSFSQQRTRRVVTACAFTILIEGCAANYEPRPDLASVETIGVVLPGETTAPLEAGDVIQLYNRTKGEDTVKNSALGAGGGAATGIAAGAAAACLLTPCGGFLWPAVLIMAAGAGGIVGGTAGAVAGATVDTQQEVQTAQLHIYEVNQVLPDIKQDYLTRTSLQGRALQIARMQGTEIDFEQAVWNGERYVLTDSVKLISDANLVLKTMNISLNGKAKDDPSLTLSIDMQWDLTKYNPETKSDETWNAMTAGYKSKKHRLSEWLTDRGALLRAEVDTGIEHSLKNAFADLPRMAR